MIRLRTYRLQGRSFEGLLDGLETEDYLLVEASTNGFWVLADPLIRKMLVSVYYMLVRGERYHWADAEQHASKLGDMERQLRRARAAQEKQVLEAKSA